MKWVYLIQSVSHPDQTYVGLTRNLKYRLEAHNQGQSPHTSKYRPWKVLVALKFNDDQKAAKFERYLKSGSGQAFLKRHIM
jgi:predicted GIY-YIG superfamily endonuclease